MTCRELVDFLIDYVEEQLPPGQRAAFERHLEVCPACRDYLHSYRLTIQISRTAMRDAPESAAAAMPDELVAAILASRSPRRLNDKSP